MIQMDSSKQLQLLISGMSCQACANRIEKVLLKQSGITKAVVNFASESLQVHYDATQINESKIIQLIQQLGFDAHLSMDETPQEQKPYTLWFLWLLSLPFWVGMIGMLFATHALMIPVWLQFLLASLVQLLFGLRFYQGAYASLKTGLANMDVLVAIGTTAIWGYSTYLWLTQADATHLVYFEASVMIIAFVRLGKYLEQRTKKHSLDSVAALNQLLPNQVEKKQGNAFITTSVHQLKRLDILRAKVGTRIAVDGVILEGGGLCDEAHLTGESRLIAKQTGDKVYAGSVVVDGAFDYQMNVEQNQTMLAKMMQSLSYAQGTKANIARFADKVTAIFVPFVLSLSVLCFLFHWYWQSDIELAILHAVSVLVIACPCALGLATPAAIMAGMGVAARHGIWFKDAVSLESTGAIDVMVFDKTGTLTVGKPEFYQMQQFNNAWQKDEILSIAASVEQYANHPLANAIVSQANQQQLPILPSEIIHQKIGAGLEAKVEGVGVVKIGTPEFIGLALSEKELSNWGQQFIQASLVAISINEQAVAVLAFCDTLKPSSLPALQRLKRAGIDIIIMSGDRHHSVEYVSQQLQVDRFYARMTPQDKLKAVENLIHQGNTVAMVGDGVNDAPAMAKVHASFVMANATDVTRYAASVRLLSESLEQVYFSWLIAKKTVHVIKQNLFFALIYNVVGLGFAFFGWLSPMMAAAAMTASSLSVLLNALRLKKLQLPIVKNTAKLNSI